MTGLCELEQGGKTYYYYPSDVYIAEQTGLKTVYAQDDEGNGYTLVWLKNGTITAEEQ